MGLPTPAFQVGPASPRTGERREDKEGCEIRAFIPLTSTMSGLDLGSGLGSPSQGHRPSHKATGLTLGKQLPLLANAGTKVVMASRSF